MSRLLSSVGIGSATVDTILPTAELSPGETVEATVEIEGGSSAQEIGEIYFALVTRGGGDEVVLSTFEIADAFTIEAGETRVITTDVTIPRWTPLTRDDQTVWLKTGLGIDWAVDPSDEDVIEVVPDAFVAALFEAVEGLEFAYSHSEIVESPWLERQPIVQTVTFLPETDRFEDDLDALTLTCVPRGDDLRVVVGLDEREPAEQQTEVEFDVQEVPITFEGADAAEMQRRIASTIDRYTYT